MLTRSKASAATAIVGGSAVNPMEDDTSSPAVRPAVPTTEGSLAEAAGAPVSSNIPPPHPVSLFRRSLMSGAHQLTLHTQAPGPVYLWQIAYKPWLHKVRPTEERSCKISRLALLLACYLENALAQRTSTADDVVADLAARVSVIEAQSIRQQPFLVQFESVATLNGCTVQDKAQVLVLQLRPAAAEYLEYIPQGIRSNYEALVPALESRFGDRHLLQLYLTQLKHVRQGRRDLQELAAHVDSSSRKAFSGCPTATMDLIAANAFVDAINNRNVQRFVRLARPIDVPSALAVALRQRYKNARKQLKIRTGGQPTRTCPPGPEILLLGYTSLQRCFAATTATTLDILLVTAWNVRVAAKLGCSCKVSLGKLQCGPPRAGPRMMTP
ncbi:hypothetical protein HPB52_011364 [Rhipicephalus sanguineus]|uniref:Uncharacterized protein n=1 Tax=Rhipicephalus sanguineus TaxID=34632 RepID=A0A9D4Q0I3_RHISA|nr:hypothetical protein HPB52_011364 [Rhipicephalus sanguineus]